MSITSTNVTIVSTDTQYNIPGDWTATQFATAYAAQVPGIQNMAAEEQSSGDTRTLIFKPRVGTKG